jgi:catechol 2,3-dioxygenase-like lactoylglutathione lyase family enzyme
VQILGLIFAGTHTDRRAAMTRFAAETLGLARDPAADPAGAAMFVLPDGSRFAVADQREAGGGPSRTIGFLVADLDAAVAELRAAGIETDDTVQNDRHRYAHFVAPDGRLYEMVEERQPGR